MEEAERLFVDGEHLADQGRDVEALGQFRAAWAALPEPREAQEMAILILGAIADSCFFLREWEGCREAVQDAFRSGARLDDPFLRLRIGQSLFEMGEESDAADWLTPAFLVEGRSLFEGEDPKYLDFIRGRTDPPPGGWPEGW